MLGHPKPRVVKDAKYLAFVRSLECHFADRGLCDCSFSLTHNLQCEVSHLRGRNDDSCVLPSCPGHHRTNKVSWHNGQRTFCQYYGTSKESLIAEAEALYRSFKEGK